MEEHEDETEAVRIRRIFTTKIRQLLNNDPNLTSLHENFKCEVPGGDILPELLKAMVKNVHLMNLSIASCDFYEGGGGALFATMLLKNSSLQQLVLRYCHISSLGAAAIFRSLTTNTSLVTLNLSDNSTLFCENSNRNGGQQCKIVTEAISTYLPKMTGLKTLNLSNTRLTGNAVRAIFHALERNSTLQSLDISDNDGIGNDIAHCLIESLPHMKGLEKLNVQHTKLSESFDQKPKMMSFFAKAMQSNTRLWKLDSIVLHRVEYYKRQGDDEMEKQRICLQHQYAIDCYKQRNGLLRSGWLTMDQQSLWPKILARISSKGENDGTSSGTEGNSLHHNNILYYLLKEKCDLFFAANNCSILVPPPPEQTSTGKTRNNDKSIVGIRQHDDTMTSTMMSRDNRCCSTSLSPGFHCKIHGQSRFIPAECCSFETMLPKRSHIST